MKQKFFNQNGMTLIETLVGIGVLSISLVIIAGAQLMIKKEMAKLDDKIQGKIEVLSGEKLILFDIQAANISFNNMNVLDNNNNNFFDFVPEKSANTTADSPDRILTLAEGEKSEIFFLLQDTKKGPVLIYDPISAYKVGPAPSDFNLPATLTFVSLNQGNFVSNQRVNFWENGQLLFLDTLARVRPAVGELDMTKAPRSSTLLGSVNETSLDPIENLPGLLKTTHPEVESVVIDSADTFLRTISSFGGGVSTVRMQAVRLIKYWISKEDGNLKFYKSFYSGKDKAWGNKILIADFVDRIVFQRNSIGSKIVNFKIQKINK